MTAAQIPTQSRTAFLRQAEGRAVLSLLGLVRSGRGTHIPTSSGERHLRPVLAQRAAHCNGRRPHRSRQLRPPRPDHPAADLCQEQIKRRAVLGGLLHEYERTA